MLFGLRPWPQAKEGAQGGFERGVRTLNQLKMRNMALIGLIEQESPQLEGVIFKTFAGAFHHVLSNSNFFAFMGDQCRPIGQCGRRHSPKIDDFTHAVPRSIQTFCCLTDSCFHVQAAYFRQALLMLR